MFRLYMADLKRVYTAPTREDAALSELAIFEEKWGKKHRDRFKNCVNLQTDVE